MLANTVRQKDWDGRISRDNKAWTKIIPVYENPDGFGYDRNVYFVVDRSTPDLQIYFLPRHGGSMHWPRRKSLLSVTA